MPDFRPTTPFDRFGDIPLHVRPEFKGGILESDRTHLEAGMDNFETKEITSTPRTEDKDRDVKSGAQRACTDPACQFAGSWHVHEGGGVRGTGGTAR